MNKGLKYGIAAILMAVMLIGLASVLHVVRERRAQTTCTGLKVEFRDSLKFVSEKDVENFLHKRYSGFIGMQIDSIDLAFVESLVGSRSVVMKSEAWTTNDGVLHVSILQRKPVLRIQGADKGYYVDAEGFVFPLHSSFTADVPLIEGNIPDIESEYGTQWVKQLIGMVNWMGRNGAWDKRMAKISVNDRGDLVLYPAEGKEAFIFGSPTDVPAKFARIGKYYDYILPDKGEGYYRTVNVKFNSQVICRTKGI